MRVAGQAERPIPQRLKPRIILQDGGAIEVVPFQNFDSFRKQ